MGSKGSGFKYTKLTAGGGWTYRRQIPLRCRVAFGGKASFRRALPGNPGDTKFLEAYAQVHGACERQLSAAEGSAQEAQAPVPLSGEQADGVAGSALLRLLRFLTDRRTAEGDEGMQRAAEQAEKLLSQAEEGASRADVALLLLTPVMAELGIRPEVGDLPELEAALRDYAPVAANDLAKRVNRDHSGPDLARIAPPPPVRTVTWADLVDCWSRSQGGTRETQGYGVSEDRAKKHWRYIRQIQAWTRETQGEALEAGEITADLFRQWRIYAQESSKSPSTARDRVACPAALFRCAKKEGLLTVNPAAEQSIPLPKGYAEEKKFSPFSIEESVQILRVLKSKRQDYYYPLALIAIGTGCRIAEAYQLRRSHLKQTKSGVWFFDWKHDPKAGMALKTGHSNERQCPLHPALVERVLPRLLEIKGGQLFPEIELNNSVASRVSAMMQRVLKELDLYEGKGGRKLGWHSWRSAFKDACRRCDPPISEDYRAAFCGHTTRDVGEKYGVGLAQMPDQLFEQIQRIDLDWLQEC